MPRLRVHAFSMSLDGFGAGPDQSAADPIGVGGRRLHEWLFRTRTFGETFGGSGTEAGLDDMYASRPSAASAPRSWDATCSARSAGPGRTRSGPAGGGTSRRSTTRCSCSPTTERAPFRMAGGTSFHFVTGGIREALDRAMEAADGQDVRLGGGVTTIQQYLRAGLVDELHVAIVPVLLGRGERLFDGLADAPRYECVELVCSVSVAHARLVLNP